MRTGDCSRNRRGFSLRVQFSPWMVQQKAPSRKPPWNYHSPYGNTQWTTKASLFKLCSAARSVLALSHSSTAESLPPPPRSTTFCPICEDCSITSVCCTIPYCIFPWKNSQFTLLVAPPVASSGIERQQRREENKESARKWRIGIRNVGEEQERANSALGCFRQLWIIVAWECSICAL